MNPNQQNNGGTAPNGGGGKKKQKKNRNNPNEQQNQGQHTKQPGQLAEQQPIQKQNQPMKNKQQPKQNQPKEPKQKPIQKQNQPKEIKPAGAAKQAKGENAPAVNPAAAPGVPKSDSPQLEQIIEVFMKQLKIPKRRNPSAGGTKGRKTEIEVNHLPLNLDKLFTKTVYHIDVTFTPELPRRLLRLALEEFTKKHYKNVQFAFDGRRNMYSTKEIKGVADTISILNEENNKTIDFNIVTGVVNSISMKKIEDYLKSGSSDNPPGEAFQALDIILKNRPFALRFTNIGRSFFPVPRGIPVDLGEGMELWKGFFQSPVMGWLAII